MILKFCLIRNIHHNFLVPTIIESAPKTSCLFRPQIYTEWEGFGLLVFYVIFRTPLLSYSHFQGVKLKLSIRALFWCIVCFITSIGSFQILNSKIFRNTYTFTPCTAGKTQLKVWSKLCFRLISWSSVLNKDPWVLAFKKKKNAKHCFNHDPCKIYLIL
jgi:hypothetical protein